MPIMLGESVVVAALQDAIATFRANLAVLVPEIYAYLSSEDQVEITAWWSSAANQMPVQSGYPFQAVQAPQIAVTIEPSEELDQFAGQSQTGVIFSMGAEGANGHAAYFRTAYYCHCFGYNQNFVYWLQALARWALLYQRIPLEMQVINGQPTGYFQKQQLSCTGFVPVADSLRDGGGLDDSIFPFERIVVLRATHIDTWADAAYPLLQAGTITVTS